MTSRNSVPTWFPALWRSLPAGVKVIDPDLMTFAEWKAYANQKTGKSGWISGGGQVRYTDPRGTAKAKPEPKAKPDKAAAEQAVQQVIADPSKLTPAHVEALSGHFATLTVARAKEVAKALALKVGGKKADLAARIVDHVRAKAGQKARAGTPKPSPAAAALPPDKAGVIAEYQAATPAGKALFDTAFGGLPGIAGHTPGTVPDLSEADPNALRRRLVSARLQHARLGRPEADAAGIDKALAHMGVTDGGEPSGSVVPFDGAVHAAAEHISQGTPIVIKSPRYQVKDADGTYVIQQATVEKAKS